MYKIGDNSKTAAPLNASWMTAHESCKPGVHCVTCKQLHIGECPFQAAQLVSVSSRLLVFERVSYQSLLFMYVWRVRDFVNLISFGNFLMLLSHLLPGF